MPVHRLRLFTLKVVCLSLVSLAWALAAPAETLHVRVLDVGEGQAVLLQQVDRGVLIDTGHAGAAADIVARLRSLGIKSLDYLLLTHLHPDHASGLFRILEEWPQVRIADPCYPVPERGVPDMLRWIDQALERHSGRVCAVAGDVFAWQDVGIEVLWPQQRPTADQNLNGSSLALEVNYRQHRILIMGDAGITAEQSLLRGERLRAVDLLVVGHHGADDATGDMFLEQVRPQQAVISVDAGNVRGYPSSQVVRRLESRGINVHKTSTDGEFHWVYPPAETRRQE